jgi:hypothetical protein
MTALLFPHGTTNKGFNDAICDSRLAYLIPNASTIPIYPPSLIIFPSIGN